MCLFVLSRSALFPPLSFIFFFLFQRDIFPFCRVVLSEIGVNEFQSSRLQYVFMTIPAQYECGIRGMNWLHDAHTVRQCIDQTPVECAEEIKN